MARRATAPERPWHGQAQRQPELHTQVVPDTSAELTGAPDSTGRATTPLPTTRLAPAATRPDAAERAEDEARANAMAKVLASGCSRGPI
mmetsp:Transcript_45519/g.135752  ORF Transcript_45519/g.135752 Transcript_45519/m.135752 type:complete len:89 (-) Transcript_45519:15-281(-)